MNISQALQGSGLLDIGAQPQVVLSIFGWCMHQEGMHIHLVKRLVSYGREQDDLLPFAVLALQFDDSETLWTVQGQGSWMDILSQQAPEARGYAGAPWKASWKDLDWVAMVDPRHLTQVRVAIARHRLDQSTQRAPGESGSARL